jgi:twitching motility protein PilI
MNTRDLQYMTPTAALNGAFTNAVAPNTSGRKEVTAAKAREHARQGLKIGKLHLMVGYEDGSELAEMPHVYRLPHTPGWFCGIANLHGRLIPVFDLGRYLGIPTDSQSRPMLLVLSHGPQAAGIVIDGLPQRLRWSEADSADAGTAPAGLSGCVKRAVLVGAQLRFDLDCDALLSALEASLAQAH